MAYPNSINYQCPSQGHSLREARWGCERIGHCAQGPSEQFPEHPWVQDRNCAPSANVAAICNVQAGPGPLKSKLGME